MTKAMLLDTGVSRDLIRERQKKGIDLYDEVWDGVYVMPPLANIPHQRLIRALVEILHDGIGLEGRGEVLPGANVSDRRANWKRNYRVPDVVVVLKNSRAIYCTTHWFGGPDFLVEIQSPGDETEEKIPFYSKIKVRELLIIQRDSRKLRFFRHDGEALSLVEAVDFQGGKWLVSEVVPFAFRRLVMRSGPCTEIRRTNGKPGNWKV